MYEIWVRRIGAPGWARLDTTYPDQELAELSARGWGRRSDWQIQVRHHNTGEVLYELN